ncbi:MAG: type II secretion system F family protein [Alphaproteobacteria bacterium]|nr:type II secretion system F family protein [Alphaproteobacteria bacterium]
MALYSYTAFNELGRRIRGSVHADNVVDLEARLKEINLDLIDSKEQKEKRSRFGGRVKLKDIIILCMHLEQLNRAGVPVHDAIADVRDSTESAKLRDIMTGVYEAVRNGKVFSKALAAYPRVFDSVFVGLVAAGERTGNLSDSFTHLAEHLKWSSEIRRKVKKSVRYPIAVLCMLSLVIAVLMTQVVPKLVAFIISQGFSLPLHTRALIAFSGAFENYWYLIFGIPIATFIIIKLLYRTSEVFAYKMDAFLLKLPLLGPTILKVNMARFTHFFAVMFNSGVDIIEALEAARGVVGNRVLKESVEVVKTNVVEGNSLTASLRMSNRFPNLVIRMCKVGEESGNMTEALENVNFFYNREVDDAVESMTGFIQPALTVVMGLMIFWIIAAVFGPLYESFSKIKA